MKIAKLPFAFLLLISIIFSLNAQDTITFGDGIKTPVKILKISDSELEYKKWNYLDGPTYTVKKNKIVSVKYKNGDEDIFDDKTRNNYPEIGKKKIAWTNENMFLKGRNLYIGEPDSLLSEETLNTIFIPEDMHTYYSARRQYAVGKTFIGIGIPSIGIGGLLYAVAIATKENNKGTSLLVGGVGKVICATGATFLNLGCIFHSIGKGRLNWLVDSYNERESNNVSFSVYPELLKIEKPVEGNAFCWGVGLTIAF